MQEGKALKLLATAARLDIEDFLQKKVFLEVRIFEDSCPIISILGIPFLLWWFAYIEYLSVRLDG